jgi:NAD(P)-dependent dehydrogenase (short-subunit alcohol dehydrogenase family)
MRRRSDPVRDVRRRGRALRADRRCASAETESGCRSADAILHGAAGLPGVTYADGTEVGNDLHLLLRARLDLYAIAAAEELQGSIVYLASSASDYMCGSILVVDGGFLAK